MNFSGEQERKLKEFQEKIGYRFQNPRLLGQALTHSSYANEAHQGRLACNERLEFLGDAVLELVSSEFLFEKYPTEPEGKLTKLRASLVCEQTLAFCCVRRLQLGEYLFLGKGEERTGGRNRKSVLSDALESIIGAIYLDSGFANAKEFVLRFILDDMEHMQLFFDSKTILQELVQAQKNQELTYHLVEESGPDHLKNYVMEARLGERTIGRGEGSTKKNAEQEAAYAALLLLKKENQ